MVKKWCSVLPELLRAKERQHMNNHYSMPTEVQEKAYIHGLLPRLLDSDNSILLAEDLVKAGYSPKESSPVIERLETEGIANRGYATFVILTPLGRQIARDPGGYTAHLRRLRWQTSVKTIHEALGAYGSILSALAGIVGVAIASYSLSDSRKATSELDGLRTRVHDLENQCLPSLENRITNLEKHHLPVVQPPATLPLPVRRDHTQQRPYKR